ncbi:MAG: 3-isopropylmalate dehydratase small subunit [Candidatus Xiphinematobacter sp.]|nr:MAG: 3-isopropylmalate dehydratase small subunit [Candidatus Xiphinematobacter sp.]QQY10158.1 MAG: 3-isopropylmalate dehydratase small subunit [Candidatus Xiphinematobacter sp.]QQY10894.1 MAG: 3-isopropylmalate dehydratase small subunit [Candidatus Xiphinematobacter sp.]QQY11637.1 MAG: 3-isopropylmalate dehydratase small subunit [Candidatus Xiphinematobacter sp.]
MALQRILTVTGKAVSIPSNDVDTDRIIPARFLKCVTFDGLGRYAFYDERFDEDGTEKPHPLNDPKYKGSSILISGSNFGCGSSREHAPQALYRRGFRAILAESYAEIFFGNAVMLGMPCLSLPVEALRVLTELAANNPPPELVVNIASGRVTAGPLAFHGNLPGYAREAFLQGKWDPIVDLLEGIPLIRKIAAKVSRF